MGTSLNGTHGQPIFNPTPRTLGDLQALSEYAAKVGNRVIADNAGDMTGFQAKFGFYPWDGLECFNRDTGDTSIWNDITGNWDPADKPNPTVSSGVFTPSSGWGLTGGSQSMTVRGGFVQVYASFKRTGASVAVPADGNVGGGIAVGRLAIAPRQQAGLGSGNAGRMSVYGLDTTGLVSLAATTPGGSIQTDDYLSIAGLYMI